MFFPPSEHPLKLSNYSVAFGKELTLVYEKGLVIILYGFIECNDVYLADMEETERRDD